MSKSKNNKNETNINISNNQNINKNNNNVSHKNDITSDASNTSDNLVMKHIGLDIVKEDIMPADEVELTEDINTEDSKIEDNKIEDSKCEDDKSEDDKSEDDKSEDSNSEDSKSEDDKPSDNTTDEISELHKKKRNKIIKALRILCSVGFFVFLGLFINEVWYQPYKLHKSIEQAQELFNRPEPTEAAGQDTLPSVDPSKAPNPEEETGAEDNDEIEEPTPTPDPNRDEKGRLLAFKELLAVNEDVKGWLNISNINGENDTKIDYVVMQSGYADPEYYLHREWATKEYLKGGSLFLDKKSSIEKNTQNLVIYGHNMTSTDDMFHYMVQYKEKNFYDEHPIIRFDTLYHTGDWKVFAVFITNGSSKKEELFDYTRASFKSDLDFLNYIYQLRIRSIYNADDIDINENDQILTLSTCSYELEDYRTVIVARKVREGEAATVNVGNVTNNPDPLYPESFYKHYGGEPPKLSSNFEIALENGEISWYNPMGN